MSLAAWPHGDPNAVVRAILAEPAFSELHGAVARVGPSPFERFIHWLGGLLGPVFGRILEGSSNAAAGGVLMIILYAVAALAILFIAAFIAEAIVLGPRRRTGLEGGRGVPAAQDRSPEELRRQACAAADAGDFGRAIALLFRAALLVLDSAAILAFDAARTPGEYRRLVRRVLAPAAAPFDDLAQRFVHAAFGTRAAVRADYEAAAQAYATFLPRAVPS